MPSRQGSARKALSWAPRGEGKRANPVLGDFPVGCAERIRRGVSEPGAGPATSVGTPPAHSALPWRPALFGQVTLTECSTMLLHTPGLW